MRFISIVIIFLFLLLIWQVKPNSLWRKILFFSYFISIFVTPFIIYFLKKTKLAIDYPDKRKIHKLPIPRAGGIAIFISLFLPFLFCKEFLLNLKTLGLLIGSTIIFITGLIEDIKKTSPYLRLILQLIASIIVVIFGIKVDFIPHWGFVEIPLEVIITILWIVGITNAFNFIDGIDGLATGLAIIISSSLFLITWITYQPKLAPLTLSIIGGCIGFLTYNFKPAKIFLGDCGSTLLGFLLASFTILGTYQHSIPIVSIAIPIFFLGVPIFDLIYTTISRIKNNLIHSVKEWIEFTGKDHFHHRLIDLGFSEVQTIFFIYLITLVLSLSACVAKESSATSAILLLIQGALIFVIIASIMWAARKKY